MKVEYNGYSVIQDSKFSVFGFNKDGKMIYHATVAGWQTVADLLEIIEFIQEWQKGGNKHQ